MHPNRPIGNLTPEEQTALTVAMSCGRTALERDQIGEAALDHFAEKRAEARRRYDDAARALEAEARLSPKETLPEYLHEPYDETVGPAGAVPGQ
jgi:hypothetical protein